YPDQAVTGAVHARGRSGAVVADLELERRLPVADDDRRLRAPGVLERVRERLLHDPVGGEVDSRRQRCLLTLDPQLDRQARLAHLLDQRAERAEPRLRADRKLLITGTKDAE